MRVSTSLDVMLQVQPSRWRYTLRGSFGFDCVSERCVALQDFHEVFDEADVRFGCIPDEQFLLSVFAILLFFEPNVNTTDLVRIFECFSNGHLVGHIFALDVFKGECVCVSESVFVMGMQCNAGRIGLHPFDAAAAGKHIA